MTDEEKNILQKLKEDKEKLIEIKKKYNKEYQLLNDEPKNQNNIKHSK